MTAREIAITCSIAAALAAGCAGELPGELDGERGTWSPSGKADAHESCVDHCGEMAPGGCWCDEECAGFGDCCPDYQPVCVAEPEPDPDPDPEPDPAGPEPCDVHPWPGEGGCADALGTTSALGPAVEPTLRWSVDYKRLIDNPLEFWFAEHLRVDRHGRLFALVSTSRTTDSVMMYDGESGEQTGISGEARIALGTDDTLYTCFSTATRGSAVRAYDVTPPLTAPLTPLWETTIGETGNYGPCSQLEVLPGGLIVAVLQTTITALEPDGSIRFQSPAALASRALAGGAGRLYVDAVVGNDPVTRALLAIDTATGDTAWSAPLGEQYYRYHGLLGAWGGGVLAYRLDGGTTEVFHQVSGGASAWTLPHTDGYLKAARTGSALLLSGTRQRARLDPAAPAITGATDHGWTSGGETLRVIADAAGRTYVLADRGGGDSRHYLFAYGQDGALLWQKWVGNAPDFALGPGGWIYVSWRGGLGAYQGAP